MKKRILFTGGGTGGHVYPALAVIEKLQNEEFEIIWLGSKAGMEKDILESTGIPFYSIPCGKLRRYFSFLNFIDLFKIGAGFFSSLFLLLKLKPDLVFSKGGFVTVPPVAAASLLRIPVFTHDSDIGPGLATRINAVSANKILVCSEKSRSYFSDKKQEKVVVTGNPVRSDISKGDAETGRELLHIPKDIPVLLVMGGSLGAEQLNQLVWNNLDSLTSKYFIIHQTGGKNFRDTSHENYVSVPYFKDELPHVLAVSDLVLSRSGASAVWEFAAVALPSVLIPLESGSRGEQVKNAEVFEQYGCSVVLRGDISSETFIDTIENILDNEEILLKMKRAAEKIGQIESASIISGMIKEVTS
jgi:UDP-N-acetylglucosamine--N-acetylmuramyl-(pentapeptide) pyrophosphoryl-undecaprenol N-acetylglucosamine transferase